MKNNRIGYCSNKHLPPISRPRVFICYSNSDRSQIALLRNLKRSGYMEFVDYSIKEPYIAGWKDSAEYRIRESDCVLVALNEYELGEGMIFEIELARSMGKPILVVKNDPRIPLPRELWGYGVRVLPFRCRAIQNEIDRIHRRKYRYR